MNAVFGNNEANIVAEYEVSETMSLSGDIDMLAETISEEPEITQANFQEDVNVEEMNVVASDVDLVPDVTKEEWNPNQKTMFGLRDGICWPSVLIVFALFVVPWSLFFFSFIERCRPKKNKKNKMNENEDVTNKISKNNSNSNFKIDELDSSNTSTTATTAEREIDDISTEDDEANVAPFHLNAVRVADPRLRGSQRSLVNSRSSSRSSSRSRSRSRSSSPATPSGRSSKTIAMVTQELSDGINGVVLEEIPSVDDDPHDILTDRMGFEDIEPPSSTSTSRSSTLPPLNERMSDEKIGDCRAFCDVKPAKNGFTQDTMTILPPVNERISEQKLSDCHSFKSISTPLIRRASSIKNNLDDNGISLMLETFKEEEEEEKDIDDLTDDEKSSLAEADDNLKKQQISHSVLYELLGTVSSIEEKKKLKIAEELGVKTLSISNDK